MCHTKSLVYGICGTMSPHTSYSGGIKWLHPCPRESFCLSVSRRTLVPHQPVEPQCKTSPGPPGHPYSFKKTTCVLVVYCIAITIPVNLSTRTAPHRNSVPVSAYCICVLNHCAVTLRVRWSKIHYLFVKQVKPAQLRSVILFTTGSCHIFLM